MSDEIQKLERELAVLVHKYHTLTGREFQTICMRVCEGYFHETDLETYYPLSKFIDMAATLVAKQVAAKLISEGKL